MGHARAGFGTATGSMEGARLAEGMERKPSVRPFANISAILQVFALSNRVRSAWCVRLLLRIDAFFTMVYKIWKVFSSKPKPAADDIVFS